MKSFIKSKSIPSIKHPIHFKHVYGNKVPVVPHPIHFKHMKKVSHRYWLKEEAEKSIINDWSKTTDNDSIFQHMAPNRRKANYYTAISNHLHANQPRTTENQRRRIGNYTFNSAELNRGLISNNVPQQEHHLKTIKTLDHLTKHRLKHDLHVYSGVGFHPGELTKDSDGIFHSPAYISTTHAKYIAHGFASKDAGRQVRHIIHFHLKSGDKGFSAEKHTSIEGEHEIILPRNQNYKIHPKPDVYIDHEQNKYNVWHAHVYKDD